MRVIGLINKKQVVILIDTDSVLNFVDSTAVVQKCKLDVHRGKPIQVRVANGEILDSEGRSTAVQLLMQEVVFNVIFDTFFRGV